MRTNLKAVLPINSKVQNKDVEIYGIGRFMQKINMAVTDFKTNGFWSKLYQIALEVPI